MSALLTLDCVSAHTPNRRVLFDSLSLSIGTEKVGLVGRNGCGKSTLISIIAGDREAASGIVRRTGSVGMLAQNWPEHVTLASALGVDHDLSVIQRLLAGTGDAADFDKADWTLSSRIDAALLDVALPGIALDRTIVTLSGGERTRIGIARLLIERPDLLLLDEPTNNLDTAGRAAIHMLIHNWQGGILVASHDRALLDIMDRIVELTSVGIHIVGGGWSTFVALRDAERDRAAAELDRSEKVQHTVERSVQSQKESKDRRDKAGRAIAAKGSQPKILLGAQANRAENSGGRAQRLGERQISEASAQVDEAKARIEILTPLTIELPPSGLPSGAQLLTMDRAEIDLGGQSLGPWTLTLRGPERVAISGPNGAGKTTLLHLAAGLLQPTRGTVDRAEGRIAMLDQHVSLLDGDATILSNVRRLNPALTLQDGYAACARFAFRNRDAERRVDALSGGERLRAGLACTLAGQRAPWLLILDEPTNHLDIDSVELLEKALRAFDGALLVVSHDPDFLNAIGIDRHFDVAPA